MIVYILFGLLAFVLCRLILKTPTYWQDTGVKCMPPKSLLRFLYDAVRRAQSFNEMTITIYNEHTDVRYIGFYQFSKPILMLKDPELIKQIGIKDADIFQDHAVFSHEEYDPLWSKNLFSSKGEKWRQMRPTLSPSFTSSKMRLMFNLMSDCAEKFTQHFTSKNQDIITLELKDTFTRFTNDVIATCAFGVTCNSLEDRENEFYLKGKDASDFSGFKGLKFLGFIVSPTLMKLFNIKIFSEATATFFRSLISDTIKLREEQSIVRQDMIHLLLEARKKKGAALITDEDITAQALIFFLAGFDTVSTLMVYIGYELAINTDIQERLRNEVDDTLKDCNGKVTYEALMNMKYLDMVVLETLRKWPPTPIADRVCDETYKIPAVNSTEKDVIVQKGSSVWVPLFALQRDAIHYPDPEKFDPERFNDDKENMHAFTNLSFGIGPRACIGSRFALMECKLIIFQILVNFEIVPVKESVIPVVLSKKHFNLTPVGGMWLGFKRRNPKTS